MNPFITSNSTDTRILFENFGLTFYYAQLLEDNLKLILGMAELQGIVVFDRKKDLRIKNTDDDLIDACMGSLKEVIKKNRKPTDNDDFYNILYDANTARRLLAHRFFVEHAVDLLSEAGRDAINQDLSKLYLTIRIAHAGSDELRDTLFSRSGFTRAMAHQKFKDLKKQSVKTNPGDDTMSKLQIVRILRPKKGNHIEDQMSELNHDSDGKLAMQFHWNYIFSKKKDLLVFHRDIIGACLAPEEMVRKEAKMGGFMMASSKFPMGGVLGIAVQLTAGAVGAAMHSGDQMTGIIIMFKNPQGYDGTAVVIGTGHAIAEIVNAIPAERMQHS